MKILFLSRWFPYPADNGSKIRILHLIRSLAGQHTIDLVSFSSGPVEPGALRALSSICRTVDYVQYRPFQPARLKAVLGFFARRPRFLIDTYSREMSSLVREKVNQEEYDLIIASEIDMTPYACFQNAVAKVFEDVEVSQFLDRRQWHDIQWAGWRGALTWWKLSSYLKSLLPTFDGFTTVSDSERQKLLRVIPEFEKMHVVPNGVDLRPSSTPATLPRPNTLIYAGSLTYQANFDAVDYFLRSIFPLIQEKRPDITFSVTGSVEGVDLKRLPLINGVEFTGYLPNVAAKVAESWASVVPLRIGGGTRLKILESLSLGTPVVSTSKGIEGLELVPGRDVLIGDDAKSFARQVLQVLEDQNLRSSLSLAGRQIVEQKYDWQEIGAGFCAYIENIALNKYGSYSKSRNDLSIQMDI